MNLMLPGIDDWAVPQGTVGTGYRQDMTSSFALGATCSWSHALADSVIGAAEIERSQLATYGNDSSKGLSNGG